MLFAMLLVQKMEAKINNINNIQSAPILKHGSEVTHGGEMESSTLWEWNQQFFVFLNQKFATMNKQWFS